MFGDKEFLDISKDKALVQLRNLLMLDAVPARIEGFDISHKSGQDVVASQVVFINGVSSRSDYRKYKMTQQKNDDYANMYEVVYRRLSPRNLASWGAPDFLLIDGGKGQLDAAIRAAEERNVQLPIVSIAKREEEMYVHSTRSNVKDTQLMSFITSPPRGVYVEREGEYYIINLHSDQRNAGGHSRNLRGNTVSVYSDLVKLFQRIRDESHRFAVSYHSTLSRKRQTISVLEEISGIGPATRRKLLKEFGSVRGIASASDRELQEVIGVERTKNLRQVLLPQKNMEGE
jgi:excinuclease ABC subunit C